MIDILNGIAQIGMFVLLIGLIYCIVQIVEVIREERERLMWIRADRRPVPPDQDDEPRASA